MLRDSVCANSGPGLCVYVKDGVKHRGATRFIAVSQFASGAWLDLCPDGRHSSKITSEVFATALQRRHAYYISLRQVRVRRQGGGW